jgi:hypothetical protein
MYHIIVVRMFQPFVDDPTQMHLSSFKAADEGARIRGFFSCSGKRYLLDCAENEDLDWPYSDRTGASL